MTPLKKRLDEKREKECISKGKKWGEKMDHPDVAAFDFRSGYRAGAAPRDVLIAKLGEALENCVDVDRCGFPYKCCNCEALAAIEKFLGEEK